ncbi:MAG: hypothetical protein KZQ60_16655 [Candidatus Thiodiazotropha sp. (ex Lucinoma aequizonata)]|nr:hypothetical protein [Candidatus Thiodiazotropha sp. (ex Lucinoma aequizonata)]
MDIHPSPVQSSPVQSSKIDSIFNSLLYPDHPAHVTIPYCTSTANYSYTTPS